MEVSIREYRPADVSWAEELIGGKFAGRQQARRGELIDALACQGLVAEVGGERAGVLTFQLVGRDLEVVYLEARPDCRRVGVGTALLDSLVRSAPADRIWLVTTNDNVDALRFYQRRGFTISAVRTGAVSDARRRLKPQIPELGYYSIPIRDEIELERTGGGAI